MNRILKKLSKINQITIVGHSSFSTSQYLNAGKLWRTSLGLPKLQTAKGILIDSPDYSFLDGRPAPPSAGQLRRQKLQERLAKDAIHGLNYLFRANELVNEKRSNLPKILPLIEKSKIENTNNDGNQIFAQIEKDFDFDVEVIKRKLQRRRKVHNTYSSEKKEDD